MGDRLATGTGTLPSPSASRLPAVAGVAADACSGAMHARGRAGFFVRAAACRRTWLSGSTSSAYGGSFRPDWQWQSVVARGRLPRATRQRQDDAAGDGSSLRRLRPQQESEHYRLRAGIRRGWACCRRRGRWKKRSRSASAWTVCSWKLRFGGDWAPRTVRNRWRRRGMPWGPWVVSGNPLPRPPGRPASRVSWAPYAAPRRAPDASGEANVAFFMPPSRMSAPSHGCGAPSFRRPGERISHRTGIMAL